MTTGRFPYKPQLSEEKANLFARCFIHCLNDPTFTLNPNEQETLAVFILRVEGKSLITDLVERLGSGEIPFNMLLEQARKSE